MTTSTFTVRHDGVTIPVSRGGRGRTVVLCPGLCSTQADLHELTRLLRRDHDVVTFDLRGHGLASPGDRYSFDAFAGDLGAVLARLDLPSPPVLVGYSLGADLVVHHASEHPGTAAGLVVVDGANPVPEPFLTEADLPELRAVWEDQAARLKAEVALTAQDVLDLNLELDALRSRILDRYRKIECPIGVIASTSMAGTAGDERTARYNRLWRAGVERLARELPHVTTTWVEADHRLVLTHAPRIAGIIRTLVGC
jgi:pimeloyl-ACP methyl ester carboxylesterase